MSERFGPLTAVRPGPGEAGDSPAPRSGGQDQTGPLRTVLEYVFDEYPHCARRAGRCDYDGVPAGIERVDPSRLAALGRELDALAGQPEPDPEIRAEIRTARKVVDNELFEIEDLGQRFRGPFELLAESNITHYLKSSCASKDQPGEGLARHLRGLPDLFGQGSKTLPADLPAGLRMRSVDQANAQTAIFSEFASRPFGAGRHVDDLLAGLFEQAAEACDGYAQALAAARPTSGVHGPEMLARHLAAIEGVTRPVAELIEETEAEIAGICRRLDQLTRQLGATSRAEAYHLLSDCVSDEPVLTTFRAAVRRLEQFWRDRGSVPVPPLNSIEVRLTESRMSGAAIVLDVSGPLGGKPPSYVVRIPSLSEAETPGQPSARRLFLNDPTLELAAAHEVFPGHFVHTEAALTSPGLIRSCVRWWNGFAEGWAHYVEELAIENGLAEGRPLVELAQQRLALEYATRLLIFLGLQSRTLSFQNAIVRAAQLCGWSAQRATREVLVASVDSASAMYTLGKLHIRAWRRAAGIDGSAASLLVFHKQILRAGYAPLSVVWQYYTERARESAGPDSVSRSVKDTDGTSDC